MSMIRKAEKKDVNGVIPLLITAMDEMKTVFTGHTDEKKILSKLGEYFLLDEGRYTYKNFSVCEIDGKIAGIIVAYHSDEGEELDEVMLAGLQENGITRDYFEKEFYENEYYIDSVAVDSDYQVAVSQRGKRDRVRRVIGGKGRPDTRFHRGPALGEFALTHRGEDNLSLPAL